MKRTRTRGFRFISNRLCQVHSSRLETPVARKPLAQFGWQRDRRAVQNHNVAETFQQRSQSLVTAYDTSDGPAKQRFEKRDQSRRVALLDCLRRDLDPAGSGHLSWDFLRHPGLGEKTEHKTLSQHHRRKLPLPLKNPALASRLFGPTSHQILHRRFHPRCDLHREAISSEASIRDRTEVR